MLEMLKLELNELKSKKLIITLFVICFLVSIIVNQIGIKNYERELEKKDIFIKCESEKVKNYSIYSQYMNAGLKILYLPSALSSVVWSSSEGRTQACIDSGYKLEISQNQNAEYFPFILTSINLLWITLSIGSILMIGLGWNSFNKKEYMKYLRNFMSKYAIFYGILISRVLLVTFILLFFAFVTFLQAFLNGISINFKDLLNYYGVLLLVLIFFIFVGMIIGNIKSRTKGTIYVIITWTALLIIWPLCLRFILIDNADRNIKSLNEHELEQVEKIYGFEDMISQYLKDKKDREKEIMEFIKKFIDDVIIKSEINIIDKTEKEINTFFKWSTWVPTSFFISSINEISSKGYLEHVNFINYALGVKQKFIIYCVNKILVKRYSKVEEFLKKDEYIYLAKTRLPKNYYQGLIWTIALILILSIIAYHQFNKENFYIERKQMDEFDNIKLRLEISKATAFLTTKSELKERIYNYFLGDKEFPGEIVFKSGIDKNKPIIKQNSYYICRPAEIPGTIKAKDFFSFLCRVSKASKEKKEKYFQMLQLELKGNKTFAELSFQDKLRILLVYLHLNNKTEIILLHAIEKELTKNERSFLIQELEKVKENRYLLYVTNNFAFATQVFDDNNIFTSKQEDIDDLIV